MSMPRAFVDALQAQLSRAGPQPRQHDAGRADVARYRLISVRRTRRSTIRRSSGWMTRCRGPAARRGRVGEGDVGDPGMASLAVGRILGGRGMDTRAGVLGPRRVFEHRLSTVGFVAAPLLLLMFGLQAVEAIGDLVRKRDSVPVVHRLGWWFDRRGLPCVGLYVVVMVALID
jgi:hypothetical protein